MNKISCNVTKDLLPVYLDDICSEESKALVEDHLQECTECTQFLEELKVKEITYNKTEDNIFFFKKIKKYLDTKNKIMFFITLLLTSLIVICNELNRGFIPDVIFYISLPILMCTFFLTESIQPSKHEKIGKWYILICVSVAIAIFLTGFHFVFLEQLTILFTSSNTDHVWAIFRAEPYELGPMVEKIYLFCIFMEILCLSIYFLFGKRNRNSFILGQNAAWLGLGLGIMYRETLYGMDTLESFKKISQTITGILLVEFIIVYVLNLLHAKRKKNRW